MGEWAGTYVAGLHPDIRSILQELKRNGRENAYTDNDETQLNSSIRWKNVWDGG